MGFVTFVSHLLLLLPLFVVLVSGNPELRALMEIKRALDPENRYLSSWTNDGNPCNSGSFEGVACNEHGKIGNISLQGKGLTGYVPSAVSELKCLSGLYLHYNALKGEIPREISNLTELTELYLNVNNLSGNIPEEIGHMASLQVLQLCCNQLTGSIPWKIGQLKKVSVVALQKNRLNGTIPASLGDLTQLIRLDLSFNELHGSIPGNLARIPHLQLLDLTNNSLSGNVPPALQRLKGGFQFRNNSGICEFGSCRTPLNHLNPNKPEPLGPNSNNNIPQSVNFHTDCNKTHCLNSSKTPKIAIGFGVFAISVGGAITSFLGVSWYRRRKQKIGSTSEISGSRNSTDQAKDSSTKCVSPLVSFEYSSGWDKVAYSRELLESFSFNLEEVEFATQYFSEVNLLGKTSFGSNYRGILRDGSVISVKSINKTSCKSEEAEFLKGLILITSLRHPNLVGLRGFCCSRGRGECFLVYDFVPNGNLSQYLDVENGNGIVLDWSTRISIIDGIAKGIEYLHGNIGNKPSLVHQSISADNVLIDQHFNPLLADSGLHKLLADDVIFSSIKSSAAMGYLAPEYTNIGRFTVESNIYAFGVILFQILSGKRITTPLMRHMAESGKFENLIDENLNGKFSEPEVTKLAKIALGCTSETPNERPTIAMVIQQLSK